jgi:hypothetical protein
VNVSVSLCYTSLRVCFGNTTHLRISLDKLIGYQSWREGYGTRKFVIEYTVANGGPILCDYDSEEKWKAILSGLDAAFDSPNAPPNSSPQTSAPQAGPKEGNN